MRKLSKINEDIFNGIQRRDKEQTLRKEDQLYTDIDERKTSICIKGVYWIDDELSINDEFIITINKFKQVQKYLGDWRLPTYDEFASLLKTGYLYSSSVETYVYDNPDHFGSPVLINTHEIYLVNDESQGCIRGVTYDELGKLNIIDVPSDAEKYEQMDVVAMLVRDNKI